jgi:hypothetical protein
MNPDIEKLVAVEVRLREVVRCIVRRHTSAGSALSWALMFDIEEEALAVLAADTSLDARFVAMMAAPPRGSPCRTDRLVGMDGINAMRMTLWMIQEAYYHGR